MGQQGVEGGGQTAYDHGEGQVLYGVIMHQRIGAAQQIHKGPGEEPRAQRIHQRQGRAAPEREGSRVLGPLQSPRAQRPGDDAGSAHAEQVGDGLQEHKGGHTDRGGSDHGVAAGQADKERIGHVVQNQNDLADHRGHGQLEDRLQHRHVFKQRLFSFLHNRGPSVSKKISGGRANMPQPPQKRPCRPSMRRNGVFASAAGTSSSAIWKKMVCYSSRHVLSCGFWRSLSWPFPLG